MIPTKCFTLLNSLRFNAYNFKILVCYLRNKNRRCEKCWLKTWRDICNTVLLYHLVRLRIGFTHQFFSRKVEWKYGIKNKKKEI